MEGSDDVCFKMTRIKAPRFVDQLIELNAPASKPLAAFAGDYDVSILEQDLGSEILVFKGKDQPAKNQIDAALTQVAELRCNGCGLDDRKRKSRISRRQLRDNR